MNLIERLEELDKKATPGPWQTRFIHRACSAGRDLPDLEFYTPIETEWTDCKLMAEMRNALPKLLAVVRAARKCNFAIHDSAEKGLIEALAALEDEG